jgi:drug/metabolite transporter (DMT)-like permease
LFKSSSHFGAVVQALFVTFLWSTSWVLIKIGLKDIPALTFAGLRYGLAFVCLLPFSLSMFRGTPGLRISRADWARLLLLGLLFYAVTQGAQFVGLFYLPAITVSLLLNFTSVLVALLGMVFLSERPTLLQWAGAGLFLIGTLIYFFPIDFPTSEIIGLVVVTGGVVANALSSVLGRHINRKGNIHALTVTTISMGFGSIVLLGSGFTIQSMPQISLSGWAIVGWLAVVNTAIAFTMWNHTLRTLSAMESSIINSTMLVQIALLAWLFLGESISWQKGTGLLFAALGALIVQFRGTERK